MKKIKTESMLLDDGTLIVKVDNYFEIKRVLVEDSDKWGGFFYPEEQKSQFASRQQEPEDSCTKAVPYHHIKPVVSVSNGDGYGNYPYGARVRF